MNVVWLKRDLRLYDHHPLTQASLKGPVFLIFVIEKDLIQEKDYARRHHDFIYQSLMDLNTRLKRFNQTVHIYIGTILEALEKIKQTDFHFTLYSHMEHGITPTYQRDKRVKTWCEKNKITWHESPSFGVLRGRYVKNRATFMQSYLDTPLLKVPSKIEVPLEIPRGFTSLNDFYKVPLKGNPLDSKIQGGETSAINMAKDFFSNKRKRYALDMSKPYDSWESSSLLSAYLTWGNISIKTLHQSTQKHLKEDIFNSPFDKKQLRAFQSRLYWHCHFIEKVEMKPWIHEKSKDPRYDGVRKTDSLLFQAFKEGKTGFPLVDACMRALNQRGWINFKQRAMLVSFACNTLLCDYKDVGNLLASLFIDYEPGIHWSQVQMQAGLIPKRHIPIYNVIKQSLETDPKGLFIKTFIPELKDVSESLVHTPWECENNPYIDPIIDYEERLNETKALLYSLKKVSHEII